MRSRLYIASAAALALSWTAVLGQQPPISGQSGPGRGDKSSMSMNDMKGECRKHCQSWRRVASMWVR